ncbi:MAG: CHAD domain-containing protein [Saprospiraceae bacterium]|nr:CHAD domain-containing protein [Saprospiraceae bacterium]MBK9728238.1 CHAD domain-containing protein [Saprospiraceae bacterium]
MPNNLLNQYVVTRIKSITKNLSAYTKDKKPEHLHRLRLEIKKINAVFSFAKNVYGESFNTNKIKPIFKKAGKIREIQINIHLLSLFQHPPKRLITQLKKKENILTQQFIKHDLRYSKIIKTFQNNVSFPEILPDKKIIIKYFEKQKANKKFKTKDREHVHRYRSKIKKLLFIYNALPNKIKKEIKLNELEIDKLQKMLGNWHDTYSAINFFSQEQFPMNTAEYILKLKAKEKRQFNALFI